MPSRQAQSLARNHQRQRQQGMIHKWFLATTTIVVGGLKLAHSHSGHVAVAELAGAMTSAAEWAVAPSQVSELS
jgi:hypothetical protein